MSTRGLWPDDAHDSETFADAFSLQDAEPALTLEETLADPELVEMRRLVGSPEWPAVRRELRVGDAEVLEHVCTMAARVESVLAAEQMLRDFSSPETESDP